ncbi:Uncharacterised protein [Nocardia otitidiscaviarum]|uniref:Uncharacterized protein n=1 Tax=Nocardia otitidiscaviarum TaxID=1823 RepID=A0A379JMK1_9NOCA|nr:hypothetical protein [Nocardia otitidiscaviarum]SUD49586.1 Uncharacterised protein [Nocardia otitidiscaviarum]
MNDSLRSIPAAAVLMSTLALLQFGTGMWVHAMTVTLGGHFGTAREWATVTLFLLAAAAGASLTSAALTCRCEHVAAHKSWRLSLGLEAGGLLTLTAVFLELGAFGGWS